MNWTLHPQLAGDTRLVASLELSDLLLMDNRHHPWLILVPRVVDAVEWFDLEPVDQHRLLDECRQANALLATLFAPDKLNIGALGNVVPQLHVHVIARFRTDIAWPRPVWGAAPTERYGDAERDALVDRLRMALAKFEASRTTP